MRLIDADKYKEEIMTIMQCWRISPCLSPSEANKAIENLKVALNVLDKQPTILDFEGIVEQLEEKLIECEDYHKKYGNMDNQIYAYKSALDIAKSAANATDGRTEGE